MIDETRKLRVFLCHGLQDKEIVIRLYERLLGEGWIEPWLDQENILPGQERDLEFRKTVESTDVALLCMSKQSLSQEGYIQREIKFVIDIADEKLEGSIFIIPIRFDNCLLPRLIRRKHPVDFFTSEEERERAYQLLLKSLQTKFDLISGKTADSRSAHWTTSSKPKVVEELADLTFGGFTFVKIPAGKFKMGSRASNDLSGEDEHPQWRYDIPYNYWITRFPITNDQFSDYAVSTQRIDALPKSWKRKLDHPMVNVSWQEALEYTKWLNKIFKNEIPDSLVFRLPTEAEWEKASRGDSGAEWPWGNENLDSFLNGRSTDLLARLKKKIQLDEIKVSNTFGEYFANGLKAKSSQPGSDPEKEALDTIRMRLAELRKSMELTDVGTFSPITDSRSDVADMTGSVWEWTQSLYKPYPYDVDDGREDLKDSGDRVVRGYYDLRSERFSVRSARRAYAPPITKGNYLGFRIVIAPPIK